MAKTGRGKKAAKRGAKASRKIGRGGKLVKAPRTGPGVGIEIVGVERIES